MQSAFRRSIIREPGRVLLAACIAIILIENTQRTVLSIQPVAVLAQIGERGVT